MYLPKQHFSFPSALHPDHRLQFCLRVIDHYRRELLQLRTSATILKRQKIQAQNEIAYWKQKYQEEKQQKEYLEKEQDRLRKEKEHLEKEIEKLTKTTNRYRASLFDHGNFKSPVEEEKKSKGGQPGHTDTNREETEQSLSWEHRRIFQTHCTYCHRRIPRANATEQKQLLDIILNPQVVTLIIDRERQWCPSCRKESTARDERSLPFTEYGINTFMMALLLRYRCLLSLSKISTVFSIGYGLDLSESGLVSLFRQAKAYLGSRYEELKRIVRAGQIMYNDETGWQVKGKGAWMWIAANDEATVYIAAESRGKGVAAEIYGPSQAFSMHDGLGSYLSAIPRDKHLYCWAHMLRFCYEETVGKPKNHESIHIRDTLVGVYHLSKNIQYQRYPDRLEQEASRRMNHILASSSPDPTVQALLHRLREQRDGLLRALVVSPNGTNNFAEQELRPIALARRISYGSDTYGGMETTAVLASVIQTLVRKNKKVFFPTLKNYLQTGVGNS